MIPEERYEARVPDTLDLAERAKLGVNGLTGIMNPELDYTTFNQVILHANPPYFRQQLRGGAFVRCNSRWPKVVEALVEMRVMSGSDHNVSMDEKTLEGLISCIAEDNLVYSRWQPIQGDELVGSEEEEFTHLNTLARTMLSLMALHQVDENPRWLELIGRLAEGVASIAVYKEDYAYYPGSDNSGSGLIMIRPRSGWTRTVEPGGFDRFQYGHSGLAHSSSPVLFTHGGIVRALCRWYLMSGDEKALDLAGKLVKFMLKPRMWRPEAEPKAVVSAERAHFEGHIHSHLMGFWGLLEYAIVTNNDRIKAFVRDGYEYVRNFGIARIGLFGEGCNVGDMVCLAIKLTDAGVGEYWEDVDQYVRNHLVEMQFLRPDLLQDISESGPKHVARPWQNSDRVAERIIGALSPDATHPTRLEPGGCLCCSENGLVGYYHAWEGIVRFRDDMAQVNLLLNRASPWLDVDSYLPYEGKVVIRNKSAKKVLVRIPRWVDQEAVRSSVDGAPASPLWVNRYLMFDGVGPKAAITIEFPMVESTERYHNGFEGVKWDVHAEVTVPFWEQPEELTEYTCRFRGNTLVDIQPREESPGYPVYLRDHYKQASAPIKEVTRYVPSRIIEI